MIGVLGDGTPDTQGERYAEIQRGLSDIGYVEGRNLAIEYLWAGYHTDLIPTLAAEQVRRQVSLIFVNSTAAAPSARTRDGCNFIENCRQHEGGAREH